MAAAPTVSKAASRTAVESMIITPYISVKKLLRSWVMNARFLGILGFAAGLMLPAAALAQSTAPTDNTAVVNKLQKQAQMDEHKAKFWTQEPITQQEYYDQAKEDRQLIDRISAGQTVSPAELDQALKRVDTEY
jgi:hypothetical protein